MILKLITRKLLFSLAYSYLVKVMSKREFKYIEIPEERETPSFPKSAQFKSLSERIVDEFLASGRERVIVNIPEGKTKTGMVRGIAKILKRKKPEFTARIDEKKRIWIIKR